MSECHLGQLIAFFKEEYGFRPVALENNEFFDSNEIRIKKGTAPDNRILNAWNDEGCGYNNYSVGTVLDAEKYRFTLEEKDETEGYYLTWRIFDKENNQTYKINIDLKSEDGLEMVRIFLVNNGEY